MSLIDLTVDCPSIRALIDISLGEAQLPGSIIGLDDYKGAAEREIARQTSATDAHAKLAARLVCAALLVPVVPKIHSESLPGASYTREVTDWAALIGNLYDRAAREIALANGEDPTKEIASAMPIIFTSVGPVEEPIVFVDRRGDIG
jgi:hypothetical protein